MISQVWDKVDFWFCLIIRKKFEYTYRFFKPGFSNTWTVNFMPGATTGDPTHDKVMWKRSDEQGWSELKGPPEYAWASTPKPESVCLTTLCLSPTLLTLTGGYPRPPFSGKSQLSSRVFSNTTVQKHQFFGAQPSSQSNSHIYTWPQENP